MSIFTDGNRAVSIDMYTWKDGNTSNPIDPEFFEVGSLEAVTDEDGWGVTVDNEPVRIVDDVEECISNAKQWAKYYEPADGEEAYADIDEIEITW